MANGSRRTSPTLPAAAAVVSDPIVAALYTPSSQFAASTTNGTVSLRLAPKMNAEMGTPAGLLHAGSSERHGVAENVRSALRYAAMRQVTRASDDVHDSPHQSIR